MCLAVPGKIVRWLDHDAMFARAEVEFAGIRRICHMACVPDAAEGDPGYAPATNWSLNLAYHAMLKTVGGMLGKP